MPGWSSKKYFYVDITNETGQEISFNVNLIVDNSNFYTTTNNTDSYLQYALYKCTSSSDKTCSTSIVGLTTLTRQSGTEVVGTVRTSEKGKVYYALELKFTDTGASQSQTGTDDEVLTFSGHVTIDATGKVNVPSFADDDWATIAENVQENKEATESTYKVGDTKEIAIEGFTNTEEGSNGLYTVRIANNSNYDCTLDSKTSCGFVVEFIDIIEKRAMNRYGTNTGGWPVKEMYKYLNGDTSDHLTYNGTTATLFSKLPSDLQSAIIDTTVVSGHGSSDSNSERDDGNWVSIDKIYLLSSGEIWSDCIIRYCGDTASYLNGATTTRQLDYYSNKSVSTSSNNSYTVKKFNGTAANWWLRAAYKGGDGNFLVASPYGWNAYLADDTIYGLAPSFRIG